LTYLRCRRAADRIFCALVRKNHHSLVQPQWPSQGGNQWRLSHQCGVRAHGQRIRNLPMSPD